MLKSEVNEEELVQLEGFCNLFIARTIWPAVKRGTAITKSNHRDNYPQIRMIK